MEHPTRLGPCLVLLLACLACLACERTPQVIPDGSALHRSVAVSSGQVQELQVVALANEGFLLRSGEQAVLIDAFLSVPYSGYDALPEAVLATLGAAAPPFDGVDLALVSHEHADHVQAAPALAFLAASPDTLLASSPQALAIVLDEDDPGSIQHQEHLPAPGESTSVERGGVHVEFLRLSHGTRFPDIQNLGHVITVGGQRVLHLGDAGTDPENFEPYALAARDLDVALVPYWYFLESGGRRLVDEHLRARHIIACHIPASGRADLVEVLAETYPHVLVPMAPLETWTFEGRP